MTEPLTREMLTKAFVDLEEREQRVREEAAERSRAFWDSVPEGLRGHPLIQGAANLVYSQAPVHPEVYRQVRAEFERLWALSHEEQLAESKRALDSLVEKYYNIEG